MFHTSYKYVFCFRNSSNVGISFLLSIWISSSVFYRIKATEENDEIKRERKTHILCFYKNFFLCTEQRSGHTASESRRKHHIVRTEIEDRKVLLEETAVAQVNPL